MTGKIHTIVRGCEAYDKTYSLGYESGHEDWSPY